MLSSLNAVISTDESTQIITSHMIYNPAYNYKLQLKTTHDFWLSAPTLLWKILNQSQRDLESNGLKSERHASPHSWSWEIQPNKAKIHSL